MSAPPYMKLYVADYLGDTHHLNVVEHGAYMLLLMGMWRAGGTLPAADENLARLARCTPDQWAEIKATVLAFFKVSRGKLTHKRVAAEMAKYENTSGKRSEAGKRGVAKKASKNSEQAQAIASAAESNCTHNQNQNQNQKEDTGDKSPASVAIEPPTDPDALTWHMAKILLADRAGMNSAQVGVFLGGVLSRNGITARDMLPAVSAATVNATLDPKGYLTKAAEGIARRQAPLPRKVSGALV
jgi:uncharacterized protein YdaU (DUF1376 family)